MEDLRRVSDAERRFLAAVDGLSDADVAQPSLLPGWTIGHVLTHVARNADSHSRRTAAALRGEVVDQYPGGYAGREAEIEAGAGQDAKELLADVAGTAEALQVVWAQVPPDVWSRMTRDVGGHERPLRLLPARRWQELEVHVVDLGIGITHREWPDEFVTVWLADSARVRQPGCRQTPRLHRRGCWMDATSWPGSSDASTGPIWRALHRGDDLTAVSSAVGGGLDAVELGVLPAVGHSSSWVPDLDHARAVEHDDEVGHPHGAEAVRHQDRDAAVGRRLRRSIAAVTRRRSARTARARSRRRARRSARRARAAAGRRA